MTSRMSSTFAVFNNHVNNADKRARDLMRRACPDLLKEVETIEREEGGIMGIFSRQITTATELYADLVTGYVNSLPIDYPDREDV